MAKNDIGPRIGIDGEAEYRKQIENIIQQAKTLDTEMKRVAASFDETTTAQEKNEATGKVLAKQIDVQRKRVEELAEMWGRAAKELGENDTKTLQWEAAVNSANAELKRMEAQLRQTEAEIDETGDSMEVAGRQSSSFADMLKANLLSDAITSGLRAFASLAGDAMRAFGDFAKQGIQTASDLEEVQNVVDVTFGSSAAAIENFAKNAAGSFGMSELSAKQYTGTMGAMLKSMGLADDEVLDMSTAIAGLAGDMASFYNLDTDEAFAKIRSGISGETEPLKQLGINMSVANLEAFALSQGIDTAYKSMTQAEQATLRYNYLMQATADAQGDFARTSDSFANQSRILTLNMENLGSEIGQRILPIVNDFAKALNGLLSGETNAAGFVTQITEIVTGAATKIKENLPRFLEMGGEMLRALMQGIQILLPELAGIAIPLATSLAQGLLEGLPMLVEIGGTLILELVRGITAATPDLINSLVDTVLTLVEMLTDPVNIKEFLTAGIDLMKALLDGIFEARDAIYAAIPDIIDAIITAILDNLELIITAGIDLAVAFAVGMIEAIPQIVSMLPEIFIRIVDAFAGMDWKEIGVNIIKGLIDGLQSMVTALWDAAKNIANGLVSRVKGALDINSPSGVFADEVGKMIPPGITMGIDKAMPAAYRDMQAQFAALPMAMPHAVAATNYGGVSITVYGAEGQDVNALADVIMAKMESAVRRKEAVYA